MIRRVIAGVILIAVAACVAFADVGSGLYNRQNIASYLFYRADSTLIDTTQDGAGIAKIWAYPTHRTDTTGHGVAGTYSLGDSHGFWYWTNPATDIYDFYSDSSGVAALRADNLLVYGRSLGDSMITDSTNFKPGVIPGSALRANTLKATQIAPNAITASELANNAVDSAAVANGAIHAGHLSADFTSTLFPARVDSSMYGAVTWGFGAGDTAQTVWKSGAATGDLIMCGWAGYPQRGGDPYPIIGLSGKVTATKKVTLYRQRFAASSGEEDAWFIVVGKP